MAQQKKPHLKNSKQQDTSPKKKRRGDKKNPTQKPAMESYMHVGPTGKKTMRKRPW